MPNRILKESICTSGTIDQLTTDEEVFFYRLLVQCDDYGEMDARPAIIRARLYPLRLGKITEQAVVKHLLSLVRAGLVLIYQSDGHCYLHIATWTKHQQVRAKRHKYPAIESEGVQILSPESICYQLLSGDCNSPRNPIQSNPIQSESLSESNARGENTHIKKIHGKFENILLTDREYESLREKFSGQHEDKIEELSEAIASKGLKYSSHYATILNWSRRDKNGNNGTNPVRSDAGAGAGQSEAKKIDWHAGVDPNAVRRVATNSMPNLR